MWKCSDLSLVLYFTYYVQRINKDLDTDSFFNRFGIKFYVFFETFTLFRHPVILNDSFWGGSITIWKNNYPHKHKFWNNLPKYVHLCAVHTKSKTWDHEKRVSACNGCFFFPKIMSTRFYRSRFQANNLFGRSSRLLWNLLLLQKCLTCVCYYSTAIKSPLFVLILARPLSTWVNQLDDYLFKDCFFEIDPVGFLNSLYRVSMMMNVFIFNLLLLLGVLEFLMWNNSTLFAGIF